MNYPTEWTTERPNVYGPEAKTYQTALFDRRGNQVGNIASDVLHLAGYNWASVFGLTVKYRQVKEYKEPAPRKPEEKKSRYVRIEKYDREGNLTDLSVESRTVYTNSKGEFIKTRSNGNPRITYVKDDGTRVIVYKPVLQRWKSWSDPSVIQERWSLQAVSSEDWNARLDQ